MSFTLNRTGSYIYLIGCCPVSGPVEPRQKHELLSRLLEALKIPEGTDSAELFALILTTLNRVKISDHLLHTGGRALTFCLPHPEKLNIFCDSEKAAY